VSPQRRALILAAIPATEPASFGEFLRALGDEAPERGDKAGFRDLFIDLERLEMQGLIEIDRTEDGINELILTESGAAQVRETQR
jgi:hypothetical protein